MEEQMRMKKYSLEQEVTEGTEVLPGSGKTTDEHGWT
jgi:hypothetical protein